MAQYVCHVQPAIACLAGFLAISTAASGSTIVQAFQPAPSYFDGYGMNPAVYQNYTYSLFDPAFGTLLGVDLSTTLKSSSITVWERAVWVDIDSPLWAQGQVYDEPFALWESSASTSTFFSTPVGAGARGPRYTYSRWGEVSTFTAQYPNAPVTFSYSLPVSDFIGTGTGDDLRFSARSVGHSGYGGVTMTADFVSTLTYTYAVSEEVPTFWLLVFGAGMALGMGTLRQRITNPG